MLQNVDSLIPFPRPRKTKIVPSVVRSIAMIAIYFCQNGGHIRELASIVIIPAMKPSDGAEIANSFVMFQAAITIYFCIF